MAQAREKSVTFRVNRQERNRLEDLADKRGLSLSQLIRGLVLTGDKSAA